MTSIVAIASAFLLSSGGSLQKGIYAGIGATLFVANFVLHFSTGGYFDLPAASNPMLHTWSLSIEEQFYFFFPVLLVLIMSYAIHKKKSSRRALVLVGVLAALSFGVVLLAQLGFDIPAITRGQILFYSPITRAWEFAAGTLIAIALSQGYRVTRARIFTVAGFALLIYSLFFINEESAWPSAFTLAPVLGTALLILTGADKESPSHRFLGTKVMRSIGDFSYSWYLWHWPFIVFARSISDSKIALGFAVVASFVVAALSYKYVENPLRLRKVSEKSDWRLIRAAIALPLIVSVGVLLIAPHVRPTSSQSAALTSDVTPEHLGRVLGCHEDTTMNQRDLTKCTWSGSGAPMYLIGDSQADALSDGVVLADKQLNRPLTIATISGCPPMVLNFRLVGNARDRTNPKRCALFAQGAINFLKSAPHGTVLLAMSDQYWRESGWAPVVNGKAVVGMSAKMAVSEEALTVFISKVKASGHQVVLVGTVPQFNYDAQNLAAGLVAWSPKTCSNINLIANKCNPTLKLADAQKVQGASWAMEARIATSMGAIFVDLRGELCPAGTCQTFAHGHWIYRDANHISVWESQALAPLIARALKN
jgi:peptidoglycan/LPS O-acetylase OafA/YrhL